MRPGLRALLILFLVPSLTGGMQGGQSKQEEFFQKLSAAALERTNHTVRYDPGYVRMQYPGGDVPADSGVCTDEIIRIYRAVGFDLQRAVHEDMVRQFDAYPHRRGQSRPDSNIDHRRVPNLMTFFSRHGEKLATNNNDSDYRPGDIVAWDLGGGVPHIGMVVDRKATGAARYLVEHNIGYGPRVEDVIFAWKVIGHYRFYPAS